MGATDTGNEEEPLSKKIRQSSKEESTTMERKEDLAYYTNVAAVRNMHRMKVPAMMKHKRKLSNRKYYIKELCETADVQNFFLKDTSHSPCLVDKALRGVNDIRMFSNPDKRGRNTSPNKTQLNHIEGFPAIHSHYCRKSSHRQYLDPPLTIAKMYDLYIEECPQKNEKLKNKRSGPCKVKELRYGNFYDLKSLENTLITNKSKDDDGNQVQWLKIKVMQCEKDQAARILFRYIYSEEYCTL
ncbi:hypothetical protein ILUMI_25612 [Ignelater luminosus]|uniref:Uncharacterized protein n=1 Tax=Ignelater luminosus TaxID=2038154 RepID=A0A8K0FZW1_IGNLU|nr:hypothetical protein ILUMI_25612 [Ignelater luminosus]